MALPAGIYLVSDEWRVSNPDLGFGASISGRDQVIAGVRPRWTATLSFRVPLIHDPAWLEWEAWVAARRGRLNPDTFVPSAIYCVGAAADGVTIAANAGQGATELQLSDASGFARGKLFWVGETMHRVVGVDANTVRIRPPLRWPVSSGDPVAGTGAVTMSLASAAEGTLTVTGAANERVTITLVEVLGASVAPANTIAPSVAGDAEAGSVLTVDEGVWIGSPVFTYQWTRDGAPIPGATSASYTTVQADIGTAIGVVVTGTNSAGSAAAASSNIIQVVPAIPKDPYFSNVVLLVSFDGVSGATTAADDSNSGHTLAFNGSAQIASVGAPIGYATALRCASAGDYVSIPDSDDWRFGVPGNVGSYTIEAWVRFETLARERAIVAHWQDSSNRAWALETHDVNSDELEFRHTHNGSGLLAVNYTVTGAHGPQANLDTGQFYHIAVCYEDGTGPTGPARRIFVNGVLHATSTGPHGDIFNSTAPLTIGDVFGGGDALNCYISELRITKGVARYTSAFPPPTEPFPRS